MIGKFGVVDVDHHRGPCTGGVLRNGRRRQEPEAQDERGAGQQGLAARDKYGLGDGLSRR